VVHGFPTLRPWCDVMPIPFPAIRPSDRTLTQPQYPVKQFNFISGNIATRKYGTQSSGEIIEFEFANITDLQASHIGNAFDSAYGTFDTLTLPNELWNDIEEPLRSLLKNNFSWRFKQRPVYAKSSIPGYKTVTVSLEGQRDSTDAFATPPLILGRGPVCSSTTRYDIKWEQKETQVFSDFTNYVYFNHFGPITIIQPAYSRSSDWREMTAVDVQTWLFVNQVQNTFGRSPVNSSNGVPLYNYITALPMPVGISAYHCSIPAKVTATGGLNFPASLIGAFTYTSPFATALDPINHGFPLEQSLFSNVSNFNSGTSTEAYPKSGAITVRNGNDYDLWLNKGGPIYIPQINGGGPNFYTGTITTTAFVRNFQIKRHGVNEPYQSSSPGLPANGNSFEFVFLRYV